MAYQPSRVINAKAILLEGHQWCYSTHSREEKWGHTFPKGICPKVNVIARLEFELENYDPAVQCFNHYTTRTFPVRLLFVAGENTLPIGDYRGKEFSVTINLFYRMMFIVLLISVKFFFKSPERIKTFRHLWYPAKYSNNTERQTNTKKCFQQLNYSFIKCIGFQRDYFDSNSSQ